MLIEDDFQKENLFIGFSHSVWTKSKSMCEIEPDVQKSQGGPHDHGVKTENRCV